MKEKKPINIHEVDQSEGDSNQSDLRRNWQEKRSAQTKKQLAEDEKYFIHQALSTPCLNVIQECEGIYLTDIEGKKYMDFHGNSAHQIGFRNNYVVERLKQQLDVLPFTTRRYTNLPAIELAKKITSIAPESLNKVLYAPGGATANGMAIKLARYLTGRYKIISMWEAFHGASLDMASYSGEPMFRENTGPLMPGSLHIPPFSNYNGLWCDDNKDNSEKILEYLEYMLGKEKDVCALLAEPIRNTSVHIPPADFWKNVQYICNQYNTLLIFDEIPVCLGRTGRFFAFEHFNMVPDIVTMGKGLGGGIMPFAMVMANEKFDIVSHKAVGHYTHEKNPLAARAALATIEYIENEFVLVNVRQHQDYVRGRLMHLKGTYDIIGDVRGIGLLWAIELVENRSSKEPASLATERIMYRCLDNGLSFKITGGNIITLIPPLTITEPELDTALNIIEDAIKQENNKSSQS
ncbi:MAG: aspartate aminotransferase family protein [Bacteroidetes bacterium]|jgi:4-aminobutyrate aminotransferase|nr:aspartate aminotransferase family protein [Bacteroidota bacterium]